MVKYYSHVISSRQLLLIKSNQATKLRKTALDKSLKGVKGRAILLLFGGSYLLITYR